ncbi:hypothetical protein ACFQZ4_36060 [Catellatospora coxensis]
MLVLLDNAVDAAQVRPLLPGTADCLVLVTSRRALTSLDSAALLPLDVLDEDDALRLLGSRADAQAAHRLAALCGRLPLALRIAAARLDARPDWSAADLVGRLVDERSRLDELHTDDMAVRSCFQASYRALNEAAARAFRMAGLARAPHLSVTAMAALLGRSRGTPPPRWTGSSRHGSWTCPAAASSCTTCCACTRPSARCTTTRRRSGPRRCTACSCTTWAPRTGPCSWWWAYGGRSTPRCRAWRAPTSRRSRPWPRRAAGSTPSCRRPWRSPRRRARPPRWTGGIRRSCCGR